MKVTIKNNVMTIEIPLITPPRASSSGKSLMVATTSGFAATSATVDGKPVRLSLNAIIEK